MDFSKPGVASQFAEKLKLQIDANSAADSPPKFSWRITPSSLGDECVARQWYKFRWAYRAQKPGRIVRLFARGHGREAHFTGLLRRAGWIIRDHEQRLCHNPKSDSYAALDWESPLPDGFVDVHQDPLHLAECARRDKWLLKQWGTKDFNGHLSGYFDGKGMHPELTAGEWGLVEYKTYNTKRFSALVNKGGVKASDFEYYVQVCIYMKKHELPWCLFFAENKNDDDIYLEVIARDDATADHYLKTAHTVINSRARPARFAESGAHHVCKMCDYAGICHRGEPLAINCRSCQHCVPVEDGKFACEIWNAVIPGEKEILAACPRYTPVA